VSRRVLWSGKASFAVVSTVALAVTLAAMAWVYTDRWGGWVFTMVETGPFDPGVPSISELAVIVLAVVAVLLEVLGWGLFWSALSGNALIAAVLAMVSSAFGLVLIRGGRNPEAVDLVASAPWRLALALAAGGASAAVVSIGGRPGVSWDNVMGREVRVGPRAPGGRRKLREGRERARWGLRSPQVKALVWQTGRALWPVWWRLNMIGFGLPLLFLLTGAGADWGLVVLMNEVLVVVAAASVFGVENRAGTQRFLAHHGARPGVVWAVKLSVLAAYFAPVWVLLTAFTLVAQPPRQRSDLPVILVMLVTGVAVGQLSGMVIRRGITAALVAMIGVIAVGLPQVALVSWRMLSWQVPVLVPVVLLAVSWAWSGDWMLERPGLARWGRLALWLAVGFVTVFAAHALGRVWGVPDVGPGFDVAAFERAAAADPKDNAAELYGEAVRRSEVRNGPGEVLDIVRRASALPRCQFVPLEHVTKPDVERLKLHSNVYGLSLRVSNSARRRREAGDLAGAWDDLMVLFRMARHLTGPVPLQEAQLGLDSVERPALGDAMRWAADPRQTPERLRAALDAYRDLPPMPSVVETIRAESILVENTLNLPGSDLAALVGETFQGGLVNEYEKTAAALHAAAVTAPWEVARARRAFRLLYRGMGEMAGEGPGDRKYRDVFETGNRYIRVAGLTPSTYQGYWPTGCSPGATRSWTRTTATRSRVGRSCRSSRSGAGSSPTPASSPRPFTNWTSPAKCGGSRTTPTRRGGRSATCGQKARCCFLSASSRRSSPTAAAWTARARPPATGCSTASDPTGGTTGRPSPLTAGPASATSFSRWPKRTPRPSDRTGISGGSRL